MPVSLLVPKVDIYDSCPPILSVRLKLLDFPGAVVSSSEEDSFASVASSASPTRVLTPLGGLMSSSDSRPVSRGDVRRVSPVLMLVSEPEVMSVTSSNSEADLEDELRQLQLLPAPVSPVSTVLSLRRVESPSSYPAPAVPFVSSTATSTVTSVRSSATMDGFPPYVGLSGPDLPTPSRASDVPGYLPMTSPVTPQRPEGPLLLPGLETPTLEGPGSFDSLLAYDISLLENDTDLIQLTLPLIPLPVDLQRLGSTPLSPRPGPSSSIVPPMPDLSREGLFDPYCAPADTADPPMTPMDMPGCR